jgi:putative transposase
MVKNRHLSQAISDMAWGGFFTMMKSKAENAGRTFERADSRYTSQICSNCGHRQKMPLAIRVYECGESGYVIITLQSPSLGLGKPEDTPVDMAR